MIFFEQSLVILLQCCYFDVEIETNAENWVGYGFQEHEGGETSFVWQLFNDDYF